jgi:hypothetical protein
VIGLLDESLEWGEKCVTVDEIPSEESSTKLLTLSVAFMDIIG